MIGQKECENRGRRWIRTTEGISQQIYSLPHLATLVFALIKPALDTFFEPLVGVERGVKINQLRQGYQFGIFHAPFSVFQSSSYVLNHDVNNSRIDSLAIHATKVVLLFGILALPLQNLSFMTFLS